MDQVQIYVLLCLPRAWCMVHSRSRDVPYVSLSSPAWGFHPLDLEVFCSRLFLVQGKEHLVLRKAVLSPEMHMHNVSNITVTCFPRGQPCSACFTLTTHLLFTTTSCGKRCCYTHFTDEDTETQALNNLHEVTELVSMRASLETQVVWILSHLTSVLPSTSPPQV